jgi:hypothetical protein
MNKSEKPIATEVRPAVSTASLHDRSYILKLGSNGGMTTVNPAPDASPSRTPSDSKTVVLSC